MQSNRNLLWFAIVGLAVVAGIYYFFAGPGKAPPPPPKEPAAPAAPATPAQTSSPAPAQEPEPNAVDLTAQDAAKALRQIEEDQQKEMMEPEPTMPAE